MNPTDDSVTVAWSMVSRKRSKEPYSAASPISTTKPLLAFTQLSSLMPSIDSPT